MGVPLAALSVKAFTNGVVIDAVHAIIGHTAGDIHKGGALGILDGVSSSIFILCNNPKLGGDPTVAEYALCVTSNAVIWTILSMARLEKYLSTYYLC